MNDDILTPMEENKTTKKKLKPLDVILLCAAGALLIAGAFITIRQYVFIPGEYVAPPAANTPAVTQTPDSAALAADSATPVPVETPLPTPYRRNDPVRIYFTGREVMADIVPVGLITEGEKAGKVDTVDDALLTAWYMDGPSPGEDGNAIIDGHVRWKGKAGTFCILPEMQIGEEVVIEDDDGSTKAFAVSEVNYYPYDDVPPEAMDADWGGEPRLSLISCSGDFNYSAGTSETRVFVVCKLM